MVVNMLMINLKEAIAMTITFEIRGFCIAENANNVPNMLEVAKTIEEILDENLGVKSTILVENVNVD